MGIKYVLSTVSLALLLCGVVFALSGASTSQVSTTRWNGNAAGNVTTEGGNISTVNVNAVSLTDRWAAFYGNVSGNISLTNGVANVYSWTWTATTGGKVCVSTGSTVSGSTAAATGADINSLWGFGSAADNATNTFATANCNMNFALGSVANTANVTHKGSSTYQTCALFIGGAAKSNAFFCSVINNSGTSFDGQSANYELMVPTNSTSAAAETYYFYAELN